MFDEFKERNPNPISLHQCLLLSKLLNLFLTKGNFDEAFTAKT